MFSYQMAIFLVGLVGLSIAENSRSEVVLVDSETAGDRGDPQMDVKTDFGGEIFQATEEWQEVKPGQVLPAGLHYRYVL